MKRILIMLALPLLAQNVDATLPVVDYSHIAQDAANEVVNFAKYASTEVAAVQTQLNTLQTYENTVLQVARMGNPAELRNLPVVSSVAQLVGSGQQLLAEYQEIKNLANPQYLQSNLNAVTSAYQLQRWNPLAPGAYQFPTASFSVSQTVQDQMATLEKQRQQLEQKRDATLKLLQGATDQSSVQKYSAALSAVNGAIAEVAARANELAQKSQLQQQQLAAGAAVQRQQTTEQTAASFGSEINTTLNNLNTIAPNDLTLPHWPEGK